MSSTAERDGSAENGEGARQKLNGQGFEGKDCTNAAIVYTNARFANALHQKKDATRTILHSSITCIIQYRGVVAASWIILNVSAQGPTGVSLSSHPAGCQSRLTR